MKRCGAAIAGAAAMLVLVTAASAEAVTLSSPMIQSPNGDYLMCTIVNVGRKTIDELDVRIRDEDGTDVTFAFACNGPLAPGAGCNVYTNANGGFLRGYCTATFRGSRRSVRATLFEATFATSEPHLAVPLN